MLRKCCFEIVLEDDELPSYQLQSDREGEEEFPSYQLLSDIEEGELPSTPPHAEKSFTLEIDPELLQR